MTEVDTTDSMQESPAVLAQAVAVVDIGATSVRMAIAEILSDGGIRILESLSQSVSLGKDSFVKGRLERDTIEDCVRVLKIYCHKLAEYQIDRTSHVRVVATSAVREASNRLAFLDRVYIATGLEIEPFDEAELHRVIFLAIEPCLAQVPQLAQSPIVVCELGGGSTELLAMDHDTIEISQTFRLGSLRLRRTLEAYRAPAVRFREIMEREIDKTAHQIEELVPFTDGMQFVAMGGDVRFLASQLRPGESLDLPLRLPLDEVAELIDSLASLSVEALVRKHHLSLPEAESLAPALLAYLRIARVLKVDHIWVATANLRDGLLRDMSLRQHRTAGFTGQIVQSAIDLGRRFHFDETHGLHVAELTKMLFQQLESEHQLDGRYELILYCAAMLHEIGMSINQRAYHKHSMYIINNSEIFGISKRELRLIALVARYHRRASPQPLHELYGGLNREERIAVSKMSALLRVARALNDSRNQRVHAFRCEVLPDVVVINIPGVEDLALEKIALRQQGNLFEEIYGKRVLLRSQRLTNG